MEIPLGLQIIASGAISQSVWSSGMKEAQIGDAESGADI